MAISFNAGARLYSAVCSTELMAIKAPDGPIELTIGGFEASLRPARGGDGSIAEGHGGGAAMGKRYADADGTIELLCVKAGEGLPALAGEVLPIRGAKPLPASD